MTSIHHSHYFNKQLEKILTSDQYDRIVEAIMAGKYSWACTLMLRFGGDNPMAYIPYRTYNRLMKENHESCQPSKHRNRVLEEVDF